MSDSARSSSPIASAMAVLRCFGTDAPLLGVVEIADEIGLHKSSVSRLLTTMESEDLVERDPASKKYRLSLGLLAIAGPLLADIDVRRAAAPVLQETAAQAGETASLMIWGGDGSVTIEQAHAPRPVKHSVDLGTRYRSLASSSVRVLLRGMQEPERSQALEALGATESDMLAVSAADDERTCVNDGLTTPEELGVSAPVRDHRGHVVAALMLAAPRHRIDATALIGLRETCAAAADRVSERMGFTAASAP